ncbi:MAG: SIR2 family NAD-dependent protein deacylase, partial [Kaistella sp.]
HGEIMKARSTADDKLVYQMKKADIRLGELCEKGSQLRPHIVWFGEMVPEMETAYHITEQSELFVVVGTSLNVYPAAGLLNYVSHNTPKWLVDPGEFNLDYIRNLRHIKQTAVNGVGELKKELEKNL